MALTYYDPETAPNPTEWLALDEQERMRVVKNFHVAERVKLRSIKSHSALHTIVENQIAQGNGPSKRALARLQKAGLSRHEALHAICTLFAEYGQRSDNAQVELNAALDELRAERPSDAG